MNLSFGKTIKELRIKRGLSQEKLAEHLGVAPQSVSKWERNEGYPDITFLIPIAEFFDVTLDLLMGRDEARKEARIQNILAQIERCGHTGDYETKKQLIVDGYKEYPYDFRIVSWYIVILLDVEDIAENKHEIERLCRYILDECKLEECRYEAISMLVELYSRLGDYNKADTYANCLPSMQYSKEFTRCDIYPRDDERKYTEIVYYLNRAMENTLWLSSQIGWCRPALSNRERIAILEQACRISEAAYPEFDHCVCHSSMADIHLFLFRFYSEEGQCEAALEALRKAFMHEKAIDESEDSVVMQTSPLFRGYEFDMRKTYDGCKGNSVWWLLERLDEPNFKFDIYNDNSVYHDILETYKPFAIEDKTKL